MEPQHIHGENQVIPKKEFEEEEEEDEEDDEEEEESEEEEQGKRKRVDLVVSVVGSSGKKAGAAAGGGGGGGGTAAPSCCQVESCGADLTFAKVYHKRHKVCEVHAKASAVLLNGSSQRFCQQCSRFHEVSEFDDAKRSCRRRLAGHNERRRKAAAAAENCSGGGEGSSRRRIEAETKQCNNQLIISGYKQNNFHIH